MSLDTAESARPPRLIGCSLVLGLVFAAAWMGFAAVRARDGRRPVTDWLDPLLAGTTLLVTLGALAALAIMWHRLPGPRFRIVLATVLIAAEWTYVAGEVLSNTITIGEPPADVGSLLEIVAGGATVLGLIVMAGALSGLAWRQYRLATATIALTAVILGLGTVWWFTHPIDQSTPGSPRCVPGNALYNTSTAHPADH